MQEDKSIIVAERNARSSAVGSAPRSGRGGRAFESPLLDKRMVDDHLFCYKDESGEDGYYAGVGCMVYGVLF